MKLLEQYGKTINMRHIAEAVEALRDGRLIVYPTDTLYALGCDATSNGAIGRLCRLKGTDPAKNLLSIVCADISQAAAYTRIDNRAFSIIKSHLPGPFTFILPASAALPKVFKGRRQAGIRIPDCELARTLARELGNPLVSSSLTLADKEPETACCGSDAILEHFGNIADIELLIDGGDCGVFPSTVVDLTDSSNPLIVRQGKGIL